MKKRYHIDRGAIVPTLALGLATLLIAAAMVTGVATEASKRTQAQSGADAVALAAAGGGRDAAERMAAEYSAQIVELRVDGTTVRVVLLMDGVTAIAHSERHLVVTGSG